MDTADPFSVHRNAGATPPFTGVGVNITDVPGHIAEGDEELIETEGVTAATCPSVPKLVPPMPVAIPATPLTDDA